MFEDLGPSIECKGRQILVLFNMSRVRLSRTIGGHYNDHLFGVLICLVVEYDAHVQSKRIVEKYDDPKVCAVDGEDESSRLGN
jgi:hypothetical protein